MSKEYEVFIRAMNKEHMDTIIEAIKKVGGEITCVASIAGH
jgi:hypothetical protein